MAKELYVDKNFKAPALKKIEQINKIVKAYHAKGFDLTLRQVFYQLVATVIIENTERSYKNTGTLINDARLAGLIDWNAIVDRTRNIRQRSHWETPREIIEAVTQQYYKDKWENQETYIEVWVEKDALIGLVQSACHNLDVTCFSCRGFVSQSAMYEAAKRINSKPHQNKIIFHLGDHDPSGIDMTRDIKERLEMFECEVDIDRIGLTMAQIEEYQPVPNPAKLTDSRARGYIEKYGVSSWELDALEPEVLTELIRTSIEPLIDQDALQAIKDEESHERSLLAHIGDTIDEIDEAFRN